MCVCLNSKHATGGVTCDATGVGNRGSSAVGRLIQNGKVSGAEMWCLDHDRKVLEASGTANMVVVRKEEPHMVGSQSQVGQCPTILSQSQEGSSNEVTKC